MCVFKILNNSINMCICTRTYKCTHSLTCLSLNRIRLPSELYYFFIVSVVYIRRRIWSDG